MDNETKVLNFIREACKPVSVGEIEKVSDLDRKAIDKAFKTMKAQDFIVSPVRCKWEPEQDLMFTLQSFNGS